MHQKSWILFIFVSAPLFADLPLRTLSLADAEHVALEYNKQLLIAKESTHQAKERKWQAVSRWLPAIHYRGEFRQIHTPEYFFDVFSLDFLASRRGYSSIFELSQPVFSTDLLFGLKSKELEAQAYRFEQARTQNELLLAVRQSYYAVVLFEAALEIERENIDYYSYALEQEQGKLQAGSSTPFEVNQSKVAVANAISLYYATLKDLKNARNALILTLGIDPLLEPEMHLTERKAPIQSIPELSLKLKQLEETYHYTSDTFPSYHDFTRHIEHLEKARKLTLFSPQEAQDYLELALKMRPDLQTRKLSVGVAEQQLRSKQGNYLPQISGYLRYSYNDIELGIEPFGRQDYDWSGGVVLSWNLFDSLLREHEIKEARSKRAASRIGFDQELQKIEIEIRNGLYQLEEAMLTYLSATQAVFIAEQAQEQAREKLAYGRIAPLTYRDSVNQLFQARNQKNQASFDLILAYYQLRYATGQDANELF